MRVVLVGVDVADAAHSRGVDPPPSLALPQLAAAVASAPGLQDAVRLEILTFGPGTRDTEIADHVLDRRPDVVGLSLFAWSEDILRQTARRLAHLRPSPVIVAGGPQVTGRAGSLLEEDAGTLSLFSSQKILDIRLPTGKPGREGARVLSEMAGSPDPDILLLVSSGEWSGAMRKLKWTNSLAKAGVLVEIWPVRPNELPGWIRNRMQAAGLRPEPEAVALLAELVEGNLLAAQQEIDKLLLVGGDTQVSVDDVKRAVANGCDCFVLQNHGALILGKTLENAWKHAELLEKTAQTYYHALTTGKPVATLPEKTIQLVRERRNGLSLSHRKK